MAFDDPRARLEHILEAIRDIKGFAGGKSLQDYLGEAWLPLATQRGIEIISEASRHVSDHLKARHSRIPWRDIAAIGNILRHGYDSLDHYVVWGRGDSPSAPQGRGRGNAAGPSGGQGGR